MNHTTKKRTGRILVVDDEPAICRTLSTVLDAEGYDVRQVINMADAMSELTGQGADLVITDLRIGNDSGLEIIAKVHQSYPNTESILLTAYGSIENAVEAMRAGAFDYITKPFSNDQLILKVTKAMEHRCMRRELTVLRQQVAMSYGFDNIVGSSREIAKLKETSARVAPTDITILISGASGTGKELFARAIHHHSNRRNGPFMAIDCSAIPEQLLESELFGHIKGSFTSAIHDRKGLFEEAEGGTVFLDEVNNMPQSVQPKLLRFLQDSVIRPVGSSISRKVDVRILAATNANLTKMVGEGLFREDLFYRLNVIPIRLPSLMERSEDIQQLAEYFLRQIGQESNQATQSLNRGALDKLIGHSWPGNVRELENTLKRAVALCQSEQIGADDIMFVASHRLPAEPSRNSLSGSTRDGLLADTQRSTIERALDDNSWNFTQTAQDLGIGRTTLWRKVKKYNLQRD